MADIVLGRKCYAPRTGGGSVFEGEAKFFDHRIGQYFTSDASNLGFGFGSIQAASQREFEVLPLAHLFQSLVAHFLKSTLDGFALGIQNTLL
jgi:hypothetical protein